MGTILSYQLIAGGYKILRDGVAWIHQPFDPKQPGFVPFTEAEAKAAAEAFIAAQEAPTAKPNLTFTKSLAFDAAHASACSFDVEKGEIRMPMGASIIDSLDGLGALLDPSGAVIPLDDDFQVPIQGTDAIGTFQGPADYVHGEIKKGILHSAWTPTHMGRYVISEATLNSGLPAESHMSSKGLVIYVRQAI